MQWIVVPQLAGNARLLAPLLQWLPDARVIEPPGFGTARPVHGIPSTRWLALQVVAQIERGPIALMGISLGSLIAQWIAIDSPELVAALVLASSAVRGGSALGLHTLSMARSMIDSADEVAAPTRRDLAWLAGAAISHDAHRELGRIVAPTMIVAGSDDEIFELALQYELRDAIPGAEIEIIEGAGHDVALEAAEQLARIARGLLER